jgi:hypothetical protein
VSSVFDVMLRSRLHRQQRNRPSSVPANIHNHNTNISDAILVTSIVDLQNNYITKKSR